MAQSVAVVRGNLPSSAGSVDLTSSGIGTIDAAVIIACDGNTTSNPANDATLSIGFWDGTDQRAAGVWSEDGQGTSDTHRGSSDSHGTLIPTSVGAEITCSYTVSAITDGIRLTLDADLTSVDRYVTALLITGVSSKLITFTPNATQNNTQESASLGFQPKAVMFTTIGGSPADLTQQHAIFSYGIACDNGDHRCFMRADEDAQGTTDVTLLYSEARCAGQVFNGALNWSMEVTTWGSDTFTATTRDGGSGGDVCFALALGGDVSIECGTITTPASTGTNAVSTTNQPDAVLAVLTTATGTSLETSNSEGISIGLSDATNDYQHGMTTGDNIGTSNARSIASAAKVIDLDDESSGFQDLADATMDSFNSSDFTLNYSTVPGTARKGFFIALTTAGGGGANIPAIMHHRRMMMSCNT